MAQPLTDGERALRVKFVREYLVDYDARLAAMRCGFMSTFAEDYANKFMLEPIVQQLIKEYEHDSGIDNQDDRDKQTVKATLRREMQQGSPASRVSAANTMAKLLGMEAPVKTVAEVTMKSAVQFYLPHNGRDPLPEGSTLQTQEAL
jgi:hypothetical protein